MITGKGRNISLVSIPFRPADFPKRIRRKRDIEYILLFILIYLTVDAERSYPLLSTYGQQIKLHKNLG